MHRAGFAYSDAMSAHKAEAPTWGYDELDQFLTAPGRYVPGTKMSFAGIRDTNTRVNLIAWLRSQGSGGFGIPAPDPARQPGAAEAAQDAGGAAGGAPITGTAAQPATQTTPAAPSAATSGTETPR
jgi:cytochrome c